MTGCDASGNALAHRLNQLATANGLSTSYTHTSWANWTRRGIMPAAHVRPLIAQVLTERLGRPVSLSEIGLDIQDGLDSSIGLDFARDLPGAIHTATRFWSQVDRRDLLASAGIALASYTAPVRRWLTTPADTDASSTTTAAFRRVGQADIDELLAAADEARWWDSRYGGGNWRASAIMSCLKERAAPLLHGSYNDATGKQLFSATAQLSRLAGWTAFDSGDQALAERHYIQGLRQAKAAADIPLGGYILACMALQSTLSGFHDDAIDMVEGAYQRTNGVATPRVRAFFKLIEARVWARAGHARSADAALVVAERLLDEADGRSGDDPVWIDFFTYQRLAADAVEIQRDLGRPAQAVGWSAHATACTDTYARAYAIRQSVLGSTHVQGYHPDLEAAVHHGHQAVTALGGVRSARAMDYLNELLARLDRWRGDPAVRTLTHRARTELLTS
ncbi:MAG: sporulation protein [Actinobacteria bacterium]|nr:sporulation protein [Actinomycetota bacterium]MBI3687433.1 sporulation protein [Actinomycetota bacterium]